jgi:hypothetical protein
VRLTKFSRTHLGGGGARGVNHELLGRWVVGGLGGNRADVGAVPQLCHREAARERDVRDGIPVAAVVLLTPYCPGRKPPFWDVKRPARPYKSDI